jgi:surface antigen
MKKNLVIGTLLISTILSVAAPAMADKSTGGTILGGVLGALAGSQFGKGNGNKAAIAVGAIVGAIAGHQIGRELDQNDRRAYEDAQRGCFDSNLGQRNWQGRNSSGYFKTTQEGYRGDQVCRSYESVVDYGYKVERTSGVACRDSRGNWQNVEQTEVDFRGNRGDYGGRDRDRWDDNRPGRRDDNRVRNISDRGDWVRLSLRSADVSSVEVRGNVFVIEAIVYPDGGRQFPVNTRGGMIDVRTSNVSYIDVYVKAGRNRGPADAEFNVYSRRGPVYVEAEKIRNRR